VAALGAVRIQTPDPRVTTRRLPGEQRRPQIVAVARRLFAQRGYDATTTREIAAEAGVSDALIYRHFPGKEALLRAVIDDGIARFDPPPTSEPTPAAQLVLGLGRAFVAACQDQLDLITLLISQQHVLGEDTRFVEFIDAAATGLGGRLDPDHPERGYLLARSYMGTLVAFVLLQRRLGLDRVRSVDVDVDIRTAAEAVMSALNDVPHVTSEPVTPDPAGRSSPVTNPREEEARP
jgi:AcrR family transcriptional regulator